MVLNNLTKFHKIQFFFANLKAFMLKAAVKIQKISDKYIQETNQTYHLNV